MLEVPSRAVPIGVATVIAAVRSQFEGRRAAALLQCAARLRGYGYHGYRGYGYRGYGVGAAAVGAAALGTAAYRSCYDAYGNYICAY